MIKTIKKQYKKILELKNTMTILKNSVESLKSRVNYGKKKKSQLEERTFKIIQSEE